MPLTNFSWVIPGKLAGLAMPGSSRTAFEALIISDIQELRDKGIGCLISLQRMPDSFGELCRGAGIEWLHFPILDFEVPADTVAFADLVDQAIARMNAGTPVAIHCRAGIGRTGMLLSCIVGRFFAIDGDKAIQAVRKSRTALDTRRQEEFVREFCAIA